MQVFTECAVEKSTVVPVSFMVHQFVHAAVDDNGMNTPRGLLCADGATEDHDTKDRDTNPIQNSLCSFYYDLLSIDNVNALL